MRIAVILNVDGGTLKTVDMSALVEHINTQFAGAGHEVEVREIVGKDLLSALDDVSQNDTIDCIFAGGGDGTISAAAAACWKGGKILGVLPAGTMNLFAQALKLPLELDEAVSVAATGRIRDIDIAGANGRPFVHQISVGLQPRTVKKRDQMEYSSRYGKMLASLKSIAAVIHNPPKFEVITTLDGVKKSRQKLSALSVSNNLFGEGHVPFAEQLDGDVLGIYWSEHTGPIQTLKIIIDMILGRWKENEQISATKANKVSLHFPRLKSNSTMIIDGELVELARDIDINIHARELRVLGPAEHLGSF